MAHVAAVGRLEEGSWLCRLRSIRSEEHMIVVWIPEVVERCLVYSHVLWHVAISTTLHGPDL